MTLSAIVAISKNGRAIGKKGQIPWKLSADMERFRTVTSGHPVIMGSKTWLSLPARFRPLPDRTNIVMCNDGTLDAPGATVVPDFEKALDAVSSAPGNEEVFVIGGGQIYAHTLPRVERLYVTVVDQDVEGADAFFPEYESDFAVVQSEEHTAPDGLTFRFLVLERKK
jgi:dihydrofolate reductase